MEEIIAKEKELFVWDIYKRLFVEYLMITSPSKDNPFLLENLVQKFIDKANPTNEKITPFTFENKIKLKESFNETMHEFKIAAEQKNSTSTIIYDNFKIYPITLSDICINHEYAHEFAFKAACKSKSEYYSYLNPTAKSVSQRVRIV